MEEAGIDRDGPEEPLAESGRADGYEKRNSAGARRRERPHRCRGGEHAVLGVCPATAQRIEVAEPERTRLVIRAEEQGIEVLQPDPARGKDAEKQERSEPPEPVPTHHGSLAMGRAVCPLQIDF